MENKAKLTAENRDGIRRSDRKEKHFFKQYSLVSGDLEDFLEARFYFNERGSGMNPFYCCLWVHDRRHRVYTSGSGRAGGCGYDKESAALEAAAEAAGFQFRDPFAGRGESATRDALGAMARALGYRKFAIVTAHG